MEEERLCSLGGSQKVSRYNKMFPFVLSKCQPQWKHIKTAKYKTLQARMFPWYQFYIDFFLGLIKNSLTNLCKQKH